MTDAERRRAEEYAHEQYAAGSDDNIVIDDIPLFKENEGGCYVTAKVWVPRRAFEEDDDE